MGPTAPRPKQNRFAVPKLYGAQVPTGPGEVALGELDVAAQRGEGLLVAPDELGDLSVDAVLGLLEDLRGLRSFKGGKGGCERRS